MGKNSVSVFCENVDLPFHGISRRYVIGVLKKIVTLAENQACPLKITLVLADNAYIADMNLRYRKKKGPTDVLSFEADAAGLPDVGVPRGPAEVYISLEKTVEQAGRYGVTLKEELCRLMIHGILHCVGYDHERSAADEAAMALREKEIMDSLFPSGN